MWRSKTGGLWRKTEEEGERGRRERERGRWRDREAKKRKGEEGRLLQQTGVRSSYKLKVSSV